MLVASRVTKLALLLSQILIFVCGLRAEPPNWGRGPLELYNQYPYSALHLSFAPDSPKVLEGGEYKVALQSVWSNTAVLEEGYVTDAESTETVLSFAAGLGDKFEGRVELPFLWRGGGALDRSIDDWHKFFGFKRGDRRALEPDDFELSGNNSNGSAYDLSERGAALGDIKLGVKYLLSPGDTASPAFTYGLKSSLPTAPDDFGHSGVDLGQSLLGSKRFGATLVYVGVSHIWFSDPKVSELNFHPNHFEGFMSAEYEYSEALSLLLGSSLSSAVVKDVVGHPDISVYLDLGAKYALSEALLLNLGLRENPFPANGTTDVSFILGLEWFIE